MEHERLQQLKTWVSEHVDLFRLLTQLADLDEKYKYQYPTWLSAGVIRKLAWNNIYKKDHDIFFTPLNLIYFDKSDITDQRVKCFKKIDFGQKKFEIKNMAFEWKKRGNEPCQTLEDALKYWPDTATSVAIRLNNKKNIDVLAPFGLKDLFQGVIRPTPYFKENKIEEYRFRIHEKKWWENWPRVKILDFQPMGE